MLGRATSGKSAIRVQNEWGNMYHNTYGNMYPKEIIERL